MHLSQSPTFRKMRTNDLMNVADYVAWKKGNIKTRQKVYNLEETERILDDGEM